MSKHVAIVLHVVAMAAIVVSADFAFFRNRFLERLIPGHESLGGF
jgi:hypothetical protein